MIKFLAQSTASVPSISKILMQQKNKKDYVRRYKGIVYTAHITGEHNAKTYFTHK